MRQGKFVATIIAIVVVFCIGFTRNNDLGRNMCAKYRQVGTTISNIELYKVSEPISRKLDCVSQCERPPSAINVTCFGFIWQNTKAQCYLIIRLLSNRWQEPKTKPTILVYLREPLNPIFFHCSSDYIIQSPFQNKSWYQFSYEGNWNVARDYCEGDGSKLAEISSPEELRHVRNLLNSGTYNTVYLGANQVQPAQEFGGSWIWHKTLNTVPNWLWDPGEPSVYGPGYGYMSRSQNLTDIANNGGVRGFICECVPPFWYLTA